MYLAFYTKLKIDKDFVFENAIMRNNFSCNRKSDCISLKLCALYKPTVKYTFIAYFFYLQKRIVSLQNIVHLKVSLVTVSVSALGIVHRQFRMAVTLFAAVALNYIQSTNVYDCLTKETYMCIL